MYPKNTEVLDMRGKMRIFTVLLISCLLLTTVVHAKGKMIFDLKKQYFSGTLIKKGEVGYNDENKYDVGDVIVTTDTIFRPPAYMYGIFTVDIKEPLQNWNVNIKKKNGAYEETTTIRLTSDNGNSFFISYQSNNDDYPNIGKGVIQINDKTFKGIGEKDIKDQNLTSNITLNKGKLIIRLNGKIFLKADKQSFGNLQKIEVELNNNHFGDALLAMDISRID